MSRGIMDIKKLLIESNWKCNIFNINEPLSTFKTNNTNTLDDVAPIKLNIKIILKDDNSWFITNCRIA